MNTRTQLITDWRNVPILFDLVYASRITGSSVEGLKKKAQKGELPGAFKFGKEWRISKTAFCNHIEKQHGEVM